MPVTQISLYTACYTTSYYILLSELFIAAGTIVRHILGAFHKEWDDAAPQEASHESDSYGPDVSFRTAGKFDNGMFSDFAAGACEKYRIFDTLMYFRF